MLHIVNFLHGHSLRFQCRVIPQLTSASLDSTKCCIIHQKYFHIIMASDENSKMSLILVNPGKVADGAVQIGLK